MKIAKDCPEEDLKELAILCLPNVEGLTNIAFELLDLREEKVEKLSVYEREFCKNVKKLVKEESELKNKLNQDKKDIVYLDSTSYEDVNRMKETLKEEGISEEKINSLFSWKKKIQKYSQKEPVLVKGKEEGGVYFLNQHPERSISLENEYNCGILGLSIQMKENGFSNEEIQKVQNKFQEYNQHHPKIHMEINPREVYEKMDIFEKEKEKMQQEELDFQ